MDLLLTTGTSAPDSALPGGPPGSATLVALYPGPALRLDSALAVAEANAEAEDMMDSDPRWLPELRNWLSASSVAPGLRSVPVESLRGIMIVEWAGVPLPDGGFLLLGRDDTLERQLRHTLTESRRRYKDLVEVSSDFAWETGPDGTFVFVSHKGALGYPADALIGRDPRSLALEETEDLPMPFDCRRAVDQTELWLKSADGTPACVVASALPLFGPQGEWIGARGVCRDVTEQVLRSNELARIRNRERLLGHIVHTLRDRLDAAEALAVAATETARALSADGCRIYRAEEGAGAGGRVSLSLVAEFGAELPEVGATLLDRIAKGEGLVADRLGDVQLIGERTEYRQAANGALLVWRTGDSEPWDDDDRHLMSGVADHIGIAHAHLAYQERLRRLSERDGLTGLFNRRTFFERLEESISRPDSGPSALLYVDLDNFKAVNDLHGHQQGDTVLKAIGTLLTTGVRPGDLPGRLGGDEFVLWLGRTDEAKARIVADRLLNGMRDLAHLSASPEKPLGLSIGIAVHIPGRGESVRELTDRADAAMYDAKKSGKGHYALASAYQAASSSDVSAAEPTP
ncbi:diguanylate cyclase (GGDEF)-like protein/PAS domain S-box-containing protein [Azospirillum lipoferum]|uniref:Diguanylate cyclase n=1 Tax=Azospirillum lipoferum TaxID=193 RepID=A0A5A9GB74_AZOLI|nr:MULTISPECIES: diguanylate cyclase [Azospirillum]KAA0591740.1 diguanylate cyclase [Azospirillum lipoferum]MCP1614869.1 diguanylate cyclase (GGDEF)-like protein/PAS domain S-box-containing protein [Azospirillum lipoferum]MDW5536380.1 diguanylate cyclase [Azospirillum sp. NL1]